MLGRCVRLSKAERLSGKAKGSGEKALTTNTSFSRNEGRKHELMLTSRHY